CAVVRSRPRAGRSRLPTPTPRSKAHRYGVASVPYGGATSVGCLAGAIGAFMSGSSPFILLTSPGQEPRFIRVYGWNLVPSKMYYSDYLPKIIVYYVTVCDRSLIAKSYLLNLLTPLPPIPI